MSSSAAAADRGLRALLAVAALATLLALAAVPAGALGSAVPAHRADGSLRDWRGAPTSIAGTTQVSRGELIYSDYLYDDYGADLDGKANATAFRGSAPTSGDYRYPGDPRYGNNAADIRELRLALDDDGLHGMLALQTMIDRDAAVATIAIDTDGDGSTGAGEWPAAAAITTPGADAFVTLTGDGATWTGPDARVRSIPSSVHLGANAIEFDVSAKRLGDLDRRARVWAGAGLDDGAGEYAAQAGPALFDLAFQGDETYLGASSWGDQRQSAALASGQPTGFAGRLETKLLRRGGTRAAQLEPGFHNRIFRSEHAHGEGIDLRSGGLFGTGSPIFLGRYQPYGLYVPAGYEPDRKSPLLLELHSLNWNQNQYATTTPDLLTELGDERGSLIVTPLNRATDGWYLDAGLIDVLEAWDDVNARFAVDRNRTDLMGYSMGGYGTYRIGLLMPDRFARAVTYVGPPMFIAWNPPGPPISPEPEWTVPANTNRIVANGLNLPYEINAGGQDSLVAIAGVRAQAQSFREAGAEYRFYEHPDATHYTFAADDAWAHAAGWLGDYRRVRNPARVRYVRYPSMDLPDGDLVFDGAYWVDGMKVRDDSADDAHGTVDATTAARGGRERDLVDEGTTNLPAGAAGSTAAIVTGQHADAGSPAPARNAFSLVTTNLAAVELDASRMGLDAKRRIAGELEGDGRLRLRLTGWKGAAPAARLDGAAVGVRKSKGAITLRLDLTGPGKQQLELR